MVADGNQSIMVIILKRIEILNHYVVYQDLNSVVG